MAKIVPLKGFLTAVAVGELQSIESDMSEFQGIRFLTVDSHAKRNEVKNNKTRIRLFEIRSAYDDAPERISSYVGKKMYCICMEDENSNNVIVDKSSGEKLFILPENDVLAELREEPTEKNGD
jgi:hypothetical protein